MQFILAYIVNTTCSYREVERQKIVGQSSIKTEQGQMVSLEGVLYPHTVDILQRGGKFLQL